MSLPDVFFVSHFQVNFDRYDHVLVVSESTIFGKCAKNQNKVGNDTIILRLDFDHLKFDSFIRLDFC